MYFLEQALISGAAREGLLVVDGVDAVELSRLGEARVERRAVLRLPPPPPPAASATTPMIAATKIAATTAMSASQRPRGLFSVETHCVKMVAAQLKNA